MIVRGAVISSKVTSYSSNRTSETNERKIYEFRRPQRREEESKKKVKKKKIELPCIVHRCRNPHPFHLPKDFNEIVCLFFCVFQSFLAVCSFFFDISPFIFNVVRRSMIAIDDD